MKVNLVGLSIILSISVVSLEAQTSVETYGVPYKTVGGKELQMDIQRPQPVGVPKPAIVFLCGNGWGYDRTLNRAGFWYALDLANEKGYVAATVDYSSSVENNNGRPIGTFPPKSMTQRVRYGSSGQMLNNMTLIRLALGSLAFHREETWRYYWG